MGVRLRFSWDQKRGHGLLRLALFGCDRLRIRIERHLNREVTQRLLHGLQFRASKSAPRSDHAIPPNAAWRRRYIGDYLWRATLWRRAKSAAHTRSGISRAPCISFACGSLAGEAATACGEIRAALEARGEMIGGNDLWIAAHAKSLGSLSSPTMNASSSASRDLSSRTGPAAVRDRAK
jgi:hypothetical protein